MSNIDEIKYLLNTPFNLSGSEKVNTAIRYLIENFDVVADGQQAFIKGSIETKDLKFKGFNYTSQLSGDFQSSRSIELLDFAKNIGSNSMAIVCTWFQATKTSTTISRDPVKTIPDADVIQAIRNAKARGMTVMLKPHVDVTAGDWRGEILPTDWTAWFNSYKTFINTYATIAEQEGVELLCIGTELAKASAQTAQFQSVISGIRAIYSGKLTYAATAFKGDGTDEFQKVAFWNDLDYAGLDAYFPMTSVLDGNVSVEDIILSWANNKNGNDLIKLLRDFQATHGKPLLFTEVGCTNILGANTDPSKWDWTSPVTSDEEQAKYMKAMFHILTSLTDILEGFYWWRLAKDKNDRFAIEDRPAADEWASFAQSVNQKVAGLSEGAQIGGFPVLHKGNHTNLPDPHSQYVQKGTIRTLETDPTTKGQWTKFGSISITSQYKYYVARLSLMSGASGYSYSQRAFVHLRVKQQASLSSDPVVTMRIKDNGRFPPEDIRAYVVKKDGYRTTVDLYVKVKDDYDKLFINPFHEEMSTTGVTRTWYNEQPFTTVLPSGTETLGLEDCSFVNAYKADQQTIPANTWTKIEYSVEINDYRLEYDAPNSKFVAGQSGIYRIEAAVRMTTPSEVERSLAIYVNGVRKRRVTSSDESIMTGAVSYKLNTNDVVEVYMFSPDAVTAEVNIDETYITIHG